MIFCKKCLYHQYTVNLVINDDGVCSACRVFEEKNQLKKKEWKIRENKFIEILEKNRKKYKNEYDCVIPVGGGKDSYWQTHVVTKLGFKPLLVTYHGNNYMPEGQENLNNMRKKFNADHYIFYPSEESLIKFNRAGFKLLGDMNWHNHAGIKIIPPKIALKFNIPLCIWGETAWDISGMFSIHDYGEYTKRLVLDHDMRGFTTDDFIGHEKITKEDLSWCRLPTDYEFQKINLRGIYLGNYFNWDPNKHVKIVKKLYKWKQAQKPFERTYRIMSNLDDMHENGVHDYLKWIKFGYGRCSDHASKDIRDGYISRKKGIGLILKYDHIKPKRDLKRWLEYVQMKENEFDKICDKFRDPRIWKIENNKWVKTNILNKEQSFGKVLLKRN